MHIRIIECDNQIQKDIPITNLMKSGNIPSSFPFPEGMERIFGRYFPYVEKLRNSGELKNLKGLMYFTDGYGEYPKNRRIIRRYLFFTGMTHHRKLFRESR